jgi:hypothetical protein
MNKKFVYQVGNNNKVKKVTNISQTPTLTQKATWLAQDHELKRRNTNPNSKQKPTWTLTQIATLLENQHELREKY